LHYLLGLLPNASTRQNTTAQQSRLLGTQKVISYRYWTSTRVAICRKQLPALLAIAMAGQSYFAARLHLAVSQANNTNFNNKTH